MTCPQGRHWLVHFGILWSFLFWQGESVLTYNLKHSWWKFEAFLLPFVLECSILKIVQSTWIWYDCYFYLPFFQSMFHFYKQPVHFQQKHSQTCSKLWIKFITGKYTWLIYCKDKYHPFLPFVLQFYSNQNRQLDQQYILVSVYSAGNLQFLD